MKVPDLECVIKLGNSPGSEGIPEIYTRGLQSWLELVKSAYFSYGQSEIRFQLEIKPADILLVTDEQRGYLHILGGVAMDVLRGFGYNINTPHDALTFLKTLPEIDFTREVELNGQVQKIPLSLSDAPREDVKKFIDNLFSWLVEQGARPQTPAEYKKWKRWKRQ